MLSHESLNIEGNKDPPLCANSLCITTDSYDMVGSSVDRAMISIGICVVCWSNPSIYLQLAMRSAPRPKRPVYLSPANVEGPQARR